MREKKGLRRNWEKEREGSGEEEKKGERLRKRERELERWGNGDRSGLPRT